MNGCVPNSDRLGHEPPQQLTQIYQSFVTDKDMLRLLLSASPEGCQLPLRRARGAEHSCLARAWSYNLLASATSLEEARIAVRAGVHGVVAQGYEAGGHRGMFDPDALDDRLGTMALTRLLVQKLDVPVVAAGGIMDGAGIAAVLRLGASAAQMGTAFIGCPSQMQIRAIERHWRATRRITRQ